MTASKIEWTERTWNPVVGCSIVSPGCRNCYAMKQAARIQKMNPTGGSNSSYVNHYDGTTKVVNGNVVWTGKVAIAPDRIFHEPTRVRKPTTWFVNSMGDLFHEDVPDEAIDQVFDVMARTPWHTYQVLTKRADRMRRYVSGVDAEKWISFWSTRVIYREGIPGFPPSRPQWPLPNVWLGVSAEDQARADERIPLLLQTPAAVRFVSLEPLLGPISLHALRLGTNSPWDALYGRRAEPGEDAIACAKLDWVIVGGESAPNARSMKVEWARSLRDWCAAHDTPFFFKQWGSWYPEDTRQRAKRHTGRLLDGVQHNAMPVRP